MLCFLEVVIVSTLFEKAEVNLALSFMEQVNKKELILSPSEFKSSKSKLIYDSFIDLSIKSRPNAYFQNDFNKLPVDAVMEAFTLAIYTILGDDYKITQEIEEFLGCVTLSNDNEILSGIKLTALNKKTGKIITVVEIPSINNTSSVVSLVHEFIHFHICKNNIDLNKKFYYGEIFSIYSEKVATYIVEFFLKYQNDMTKKIENTRLDSIVWHYTERIEQLKEIYKIYNTAKKNNSLPMAILKEMERDCPWLINTKIKNAYYNYKDNLAYSYGFGYLYAEALFQRFLDDTDKASNDFMDTLNGNIKIEDLFKNYGVGLNSHTLTEARQKIKSIKK